MRRLCCGGRRWRRESESFCVGKSLKVVTFWRAGLFSDSSGTINLGISYVVWLMFLVSK